MVERSGRRPCPPRILAALLAASLASAAAADPLDPLDPVGLSGGPGGAPRWLDPAPRRLALPLPSFASRLRWEIATASPAPAPPAASLAGWLPSILLIGAFAATQFAIDPPADSRWTDRNGFDRAIRRPLRGGSRGTRDAAALSSDVLFAGMGAALAADWWWLREEYGLLRSVQVDSRWLMANNVATRVGKVAAGRQRPYVRPCGSDADYVSSCGNGRDGNTSFLSGHASNTATIAGLLCTRHLNRRDAGAADAWICGGAAAGALATGVLRIVSEHHFATDVIAGWAVGAMFGYYLPSHFDYLGTPGDPLALASFAPVVGRDFYGFRYGFVF